MEADRLASEFAALGAPTAAAQITPKPDAEFPIYGKRAWRMLQLFMALGTQWRVQIVAGLTKARVVYFGLDYRAVEATAQLRQQPLDPDAFEDLQAMEHAALAVLNKE